MKKSKLFLIGVLFLAFVSCVSVACKDKSDDKNDNPNKTNYSDGTHTLLGFENPSDLYSVRAYIPDILDAYGRIDVVNDERYAAKGSGSLKYSYISGKEPSVVLYPEKTAYADLPVDRILSFGISVYSAASETQSVTLAVVSGKEPVYEETRELKSGRNDYSFSLDPMIVKFRADEINAFLVGFQDDYACDYYLDEWTVTLGESKLSETQQKALAFAETVDTIESAGTPSEKLLTEAYDSYKDFDEACRSAVKEYYDKYKKQVEKFIEIKSWDEDPEKTALAYFSENYGVLQLLGNENAEYEYFAEAFDGDGGVTISSKQVKGKSKIEFYIASTVIDNYDFVSFKVTNNGQTAVKLSFNDSENAAEIAAGETKSVELPMTDLKESGNYITAECNAETAEITLSTIYANALPRDEVYTSALKTDKYTAEGNADKSSDDDKTVFDVKDENARVVPQKEVKTVNAAQNVTLSIVADKAINATFCDENGNAIKTVSVSSTAALITLSDGEYEKTEYIRFGGAVRVTLSDMVVTRTADKDYAEVLLLNDYVVKGDSVTDDNVREAFYFVCLFERMLLYKQNYMQSNDSAVYADIVKRAAVVSEKFKASVKKIEDGTASADDYSLVSDLCDGYSALTTVQPLTNGESKTIREAKKGELLKYRYSVYDFDDFSAAYKFNAEYFCIDWNGSVSNETFGGGKKLAINVNRVASEGANPNRIYVSYDGSVSTDYDYVIWRVYNPTKETKQMIFIDYGWSNSIATFTFIPGEWTEIKISANDFRRAGQFVIINCNAGDKIYIDNVYAYSRQYVQAIIDELPSADDFKESDGYLLTAARNAYNKLSAAAKAKVDDGKLTACEKKMAEFPYRSIFNMSAPGVLSGFTHPTNISAYLWDGDFSIADDSSYGKVLAVHTTGTTGTQPVLYMGYNLAGIDLSDYKTIKFSVYNPKAVDLNFALITLGYGMAYHTQKLNKNAWTEITVSADDFKKAGFFYIANVGKGEEVTFLITNIVAYK